MRKVFQFRAEVPFRVNLRQQGPKGPADSSPMRQIQPPARDPAPEADIEADLPPAFATAVLPTIGGAASSCPATCPITLPVTVVLEVAVQADCRVVDIICGTPR